MIRSGLGINGQFTPSLNLDFTKGVMPAGLTFTRNSIATRVNAQGLVETVAADQPRFDYDPITLQPRGILIEEARTNLCLNSQQPQQNQNSWTVTGASITTNYSTLLGVPAARCLRTGAAQGSSIGGVQYVNLPAGNTAGRQVTVSCWMQATAASRKTFRFQVIEMGGASTEASSQSPLLTLTTTPQLYSYTYTISATDRDRVRVFFGVADGNGDYDLIQNMCQVEQGAFATSYIPTTSSAVARFADYCYMPVGGWFGKTEGALVTSIIPSANTGYMQIASLDDGVNTNCISLANSGGGARVEITQGGTNSIAFLQAPGGFNLGAVNSASMTYSAGGTGSVFLNGLSSTQAGPVVMPSTLNRLNIGSRRNGEAFLNGYIRRVVYYPKRLSNSFLQSLTA